MKPVVLLFLLFHCTLAAEFKFSKQVESTLSQYCLECHDHDIQKGNLNIEIMLDESMDQHSENWEKVYRLLLARQMPPVGKDRPSDENYIKTSFAMVKTLDAFAKQHPKIAKVPSLRRLTRFEYQNAIRDLLHLNIDAKAYLPSDSSSHGFDNITVSNLSPSLIERYISAAQKISRLALGASHLKPSGKTVRIRPDMTQENYVVGLPLGTRGGTSIQYHFPQTGIYKISVKLSRDRNESVEGLTKPHKMKMFLDHREMASFDVKFLGKDKHDQVDQHLHYDMKVDAGEHNLGIAFLRKSLSIEEGTRQPTQSHFNLHRHPRKSPAIYQISITGPYEAQNPGSTKSRQKILIATPSNPSEELDCAIQIINPLLRQAFRRSVDEKDLEQPLNFYKRAREEGQSFEEGIQAAISAILMSRDFLFRSEGIDTLPSEGIVPLSSFELASRLSFFIWSSLPDQTLLDLAEQGKLHQHDILDAQVKRMLKDPKSEALIKSFADQWLYLRNINSLNPNSRLFPDFDQNLREAFRSETEHLFREVLQEDKSVLSLINSDSTYLNERLAKHYGIPQVYGSHFRKVEDVQKYQRGGILRHASILSVTSYATRTSPVLRGSWILENILGTPPPPAPTDVPTLEENSVNEKMSFRERFEQHRSNTSCSSCHNVIDPLGFALEHYDATGAWRELDNEQQVDAAGGFADGSTFIGHHGLEQAILKRPEAFVRTMIEKLMTYGLGRGIEHHDAAEIRRLVLQAKENNFVFSALIQGITKSLPFTHREHRNKFTHHSGSSH